MGNLEPLRFTTTVVTPDSIMRTFLSLALVASASAFSGIAPAPMTSKVSMSKVARTPELEMQASSKATVIGAAAVGGIVGVYFFHELQTGLIFAAILAYASTTASQFGSAAESSGETAVKAYDKTLELNAQYDLLPKLKSATDTATTAASNLDKNYGITSKIDEQLKLSQAVDKASAKVNELKSSVTNKVDDLKSKATE